MKNNVLIIDDDLEICKQIKYTLCGTDTGAYYTHSITEALPMIQARSYTLIGNAVDIIKAWQRQGANIIYCTSRKKKQADDMAHLLKKHGFCGTYLIAREPRESYADIVEILNPDVLIEDDCKSIGGAWQMCITKVKPELREKINHIAVPEFNGIDNLPVNIKQL